MNDWELIKSIIIPICASIIGGIFTCIGVNITIIHENKREKKKENYKINLFFIG